jgi:hypothetical protein
VPAGTAAPLPGCTGSPTLCSPVGPFGLLRLPGNSVADPDPVPFLHLVSGIRDGLNPGMNNPDHISARLEIIFWVKILNFFDADPDPLSGIQNLVDPGSGIRDGKKF